jgi:hypothetical protein
MIERVVAVGALEKGDCVAVTRLMVEALLEDEGMVGVTLGTEVAVEGFAELGSAEVDVEVNICSSSSVVVARG